MIRHFLFSEDAGKLFRDCKERSEMSTFARSGDHFGCRLQSRLEKAVTLMTKEVVRELCRN